jgi:hypothetical protein
MTAKTDNRTTVTATRQKQQQIPPLRCGMTNKKTGNNNNNPKNRQRRQTKTGNDDKSPKNRQRQGQAL